MGSGDHFAKIGRTTNVTYGKCDGAKAVCDRENVSVQFNYDGEEVSMLKNTSREYLIINKKRGAGDFEESCFADGGDSGSFILNEMETLLAFCLVVHRASGHLRVSL